jgi:hypothetical protein
MNAQKLLMGVATTAVGWMVGLWAFKQFMSGGSAKSVTIPTDVATTPPTDSKSFNEEGYDYDGY